MSDIAIRVENLSKQYHIGGPQARYQTLRDTLMDLAAAPVRRLRSLDQPARADHTIWALKDVSFEVQRGEVVGIIGRNGAGKSTLLKILSRITEPTEGYAEIYGRVGSLLEVGTGFHPELTGRENIYLSGAILGMRRTEIGRKFDEIVHFAEIEEFLDTPVKRYSSGMHVRLAFAVAAHLEPEILLVDEVLAVGDVAFQRKCLGKMQDVSSQGRTVLFVSHDMAAIEGLCGSAYMLQKGRLATTGKTRDVVQAYLSMLPLSVDGALWQRVDRRGSGRLRFTDIVFRTATGVPTEAVQCGQDLEISIGYRSDTGTLGNVSVAISVNTLSGHCMLVLSSQMVGRSFDALPSSGRFCCAIQRFPLAPGQYYLSLHCEVNGVLADWVQQAVQLTVEAGDFFGTGRLPPPTHGGLLIPHSWHVTAADDALREQ